MFFIIFLLMQLTNVVIPLDPSSLHHTFGITAVPLGPLFMHGFGTIKVTDVPMLSSVLEFTPMIQLLEKTGGCPFSKTGCNVTESCGEWDAIVDMFRKPLGMERRRSRYARSVRDRYNSHKDRNAQRNRVMKDVETSPKVGGARTRDNKPVTIPASHLLPRPSVFKPTERKEILHPRNVIEHPVLRPIEQDHDYVLATTFSNYVSSNVKADSCEKELSLALEDYAVTMFTLLAKLILRENYITMAVTGQVSYVFHHEKAYPVSIQLIHCYRRRCTVTHTTLTPLIDDKNGDCPIYAIRYYPSVITINGMASTFSETPFTLGACLINGSYESFNYMIHSGDVTDQGYITSEISSIPIHSKAHCFIAVLDNTIQRFFRLCSFIGLGSNNEGMFVVSDRTVMSFPKSTSCCGKTYPAMEASTVSCERNTPVYCEGVPIMNIWPQESRLPTFLALEGKMQGETGTMFEYLMFLLGLGLTGFAIATIVGYLLTTKSRRDKRNSRNYLREQQELNVLDNE